jgi:hypothetical protein
MRRWPTWLVVGALAALGAVAAADALRGGETRVVAPKEPHERQASAPEETATEPNGVLYYSNAKDDCRLDGLSLPDLGNAPPPKLRSCRFSLSPDGLAVATGRLAWSSRGLYARERRDRIELGSPASSRTVAVLGRAPAFKPEGTFTYARGEAVIAWTTDCAPGSALFTLPADNATARCRRVIFTSSQLRRGLPDDPGDPITIRQLAWLSETRVALVVSVDLGPSDIVAVLEGRKLVAATPRIFGRLRIETSPRGGYYSVWTGDDLFTIRDRNGLRIAFPSLPGVHALTWSPDERWTAAATEHSVYLFRTNDDETPVRRLPILARDLAWR